MRLAVLEIGSNAIRLASAVWHPSGTLELVLRQHIPLRLGIDCQNDQKITRNINYLTT